MPRKTAAEKAAEEAATAEAARRETEKQRLNWAGAIILALALFAGGYAIGQSNPPDGAAASAPAVFDGDFPMSIDDPLDDRDFDRSPLQRNLECQVIGRDGRLIELVCDAIGPIAIPDGDLEGRGDERRDDEERRIETPGFLGIGIRDTDAGVVVVELLDDGPAARAGIELDDAIVAFGDSEIRTGDQLSDLIFEAGAGAEVPITVRRFDAEITVIVELGEWPG